VLVISSAFVIMSGKISYSFLPITQAEHSHVKLEDVVDDVTVTVDPMRNHRWIRDGDSERHAATAARAFNLKKGVTSELANWHQINSNHPYLAAVPEVLKSVKGTIAFPSRDDNRGEGSYSGPHHHRGAERDMTRHMALPAISHLLREGKLAEKSIGHIEAEMREAERTRGARIFTP